MHNYGQYCPVALAAELLSERWTLLVLREIAYRGKRFGDIRRGIPLMSQSLLTKRLRTLEAAQIIERRFTPTGGTRYHLTEAGLALEPLIMQIGEWSKEWLQTPITDGKLDPGVLMWDIRNRVEPQKLPPGKIVVQITFDDLREAERHWWLVNEYDEVDLCLEDPGYEVDLYIVTKLRVLTEIWLGDLSLARAINEAKLKVHGRSDVRRCLRAWLRLSPFAGIRRKVD